MLQNAPARTWVMTARKMQDQPTPGGDPKWLHAEPGQ